MTRSAAAARRELPDQSSTVVADLLALGAGVGDAGPAGTDDEVEEGVEAGDGHGRGQTTGIPRV